MWSSQKISLMRHWRHWTKEKPDLSDIFRQCPFSSILLLLFQIIGLGTLLAIIILAAIISCVRKRCCSLLLEELSLEEEQTVVKEVLRERAKDKWTAKLNTSKAASTQTNPEAGEIKVNQCVVCVKLHISLSCSHGLLEVCLCILSNNKYLCWIINYGRNWLKLKTLV